MVFKSLSIFLIFLLGNINTNNFGVLQSDEIDINIDVSNLVAEFDEKINYNLKVKDNDLNVQTIEKILPDLDDNKYFNLKVTSEKADIKKFEIIEIKDYQNPNKKNKILLIEYQLKNNANMNFDINKVERESFVTDIDFCICFKTKDFQVVKNKIFLRDVPFSNIEKNEDNMILKINLFNLPKNADIQKIDVTKSDKASVQGNNYNNANTYIQKSNNNSERQGDNRIKNIDFNRNKNISKIITYHENEKILNKNSKTKEKDYSYNFNQALNKDSISFLSINFTRVNKTIINNTIINKPYIKNEVLNKKLKEIKTINIHKRNDENNGDMNIKNKLSQKVIIDYLDKLKSDEDFYSCNLFFIFWF